MKQFLISVLVFLIALAITVLAAEYYIRITREPHFEGPPLILLQRDRPYKFLLNPAHPEINEQGLRDTPIETPKPKGVYRILVLGDSVTFGLFVDAEEAYPQVLEKKLRTEDENMEVINAGVNGYTPYNELYYFDEKGASFEPDLVLVAFCFNDIVNPVRHWRSYTSGPWNLPLEAFPAGERGVRVAEEIQHGLWGRLLNASALLRYFDQQIRLRKSNENRFKKIKGESWPVYIDDQSPLTIDLLKDHSSTQWKWLTNTYRKLRTETEEHGARFAVIFFPLAYQLDKDYPLLPQEDLMGFCREEGLPCLDLLPLFRSHAGESLFMGDHEFYHQDVWHLSPRGHEVATEGILEFLKSNNLLRAKDRAA